MYRHWVIRLSRRIRMEFLQFLLESSQNFNRVTSHKNDSPIFYNFKHHGYRPRADRISLTGSIMFSRDLLQEFEL